MLIKDAIKKMLKDNRKTQAEFANEAGYKSQGSVSITLMRNNITAKTLIDWADVLGYEVVLRPIKGTDKAERTIVLNNEE